MAAATGRGRSPEVGRVKRTDLLTTAKILEARAAKKGQVVISREMAKQLAELCRDVAWQEDEAAA